MSLRDPIATTIAAYEAELALEAKLLARAKKSEVALRRTLERSAAGVLEAAFSPAKALSLASAGWSLATGAVGLGGRGGAKSKGGRATAGRQVLEAAAMLEASGDPEYLPASLQLQVGAIEKIIRDAFVPDAGLAALVRERVREEARRAYLVPAAAGEKKATLGMISEMVGILRKVLLAGEPQASAFVESRFRPVLARHRGERTPTAELLASRTLQKWLEDSRMQYRNPLAHGETIELTSRSYRGFCTRAWAASSVEEFLAEGVSPRLVKAEQPGWASMLDSTTRRKS